MGAPTPSVNITNVRDDGQWFEVDYSVISTKINESNFFDITVSNVTEGYSSDVDNYVDSYYSDTAVVKHDNPSQDILIEISGYILQSEEYDVFSDYTWEGSGSGGGGEEFTLDNIEVDISSNDGSQSPGGMIYVDYWIDNKHSQAVVLDGDFTIGGVIVANLDATVEANTEMSVTGEALEVPSDISDGQADVCLDVINGWFE